MYVIRDNKSFRYVAYPGGKSSFTAKLEDARQFPTREIAEKERCPESETVISLDLLLGRKC